MTLTKNLNIIKDKQTEKRRFTSNWSIEFNEKDIIYINNEDRVILDLFKLSKEHYGSEKYYCIIAYANDIKFPFNVRESSLIIPRDLNQILSTLE